MSLELPMMFISQHSPETPCFLIMCCCCWSTLDLTGTDTSDDVEDFLLLSRFSASLLLSLGSFRCPLVVVVPALACRLEKLHSHFKFLLACCWRTLWNTCIQGVPGRFHRNRGKICSIFGQFWKRKSWKEKKEGNCKIKNSIWHRWDVAAIEWRI